MVANFNAGVTPASDIPATSKISELPTIKK
jgi:hypothetical protein